MAPSVCIRRYAKSKSNSFRTKKMKNKEKLKKKKKTTKKKFKKKEEKSKENHEIIKSELRLLAKKYRVKL